jgi:SAM-dependent methyltransferase
MKLKSVLEGAITLLPGAQAILHRPTGGTDSARYCYTVWLRHLVLAQRAGLRAFPGVVAELGPGDSIGIGLAALLSGAERYVGLDVVLHANLERNLTMLEELVDLFSRRSAIPDQDEFPEVKPGLERYDFPAHVLPATRLAEALAPARLERIRRALREAPGAGSPIEYCAPWHDAAVIKPGSVELIFSQAVLEHVDDLEGAYAAMRRWLRPGGLMSHQIDFRSHGTAHEWNGHWCYSDLTWRLVRGGRPYLLNRQPRSVHARLLAAQGFRIVFEQAVTLASGVPRERLARRFRDLADDDLATAGWFVQAVAAPGPA